MPKAANALTVAQLLVLSTAAGRADHMVMPLPINLRARGASQQRLLTSLLKLLLVEEVPTETATLGWRQNDAGQSFALQLTTAGLNAVVDLAQPAAHEPPTDNDAAGELESPTIVQPSATNLLSAAETKPKSPSGKLATILAAIGGEKGATVEELVALTGWQKHTARAALTRLRQRGYPLQLIQQENRKAYCLTAANGA